MAFDDLTGDGVEEIAAIGEPGLDLFKRIERATRPYLVVNGELGFRGRTLDFLHEVGPLLVGLDVVGSLDDDSAVSACVNLEDLSLNTDCSQPIEWSRLSGLRHLFSYSSRLNLSFAQLSGLESLSVYGAKDSDLDLVTSSRIHLLRLMSARITRIPVGDTWSGLRQLEVLGAPKLVDFAGIASMPQLQSLFLEKCRALNSLASVGECVRLARLAVSDCGPVESLTPLIACEELVEIFFDGSTNVLDGDLSVLGALPNLTRAMYRHRRHYRGAPSKFPSQD